MLIALTLSGLYRLLAQILNAVKLKSSSASGQLSSFDARIRFSAPPERSTNFSFAEGVSYPRNSSYPISLLRFQVRHGSRMHASLSKRRSKSPFG